jgi:hypothetical protein
LASEESSADYLVTTVDKFVFRAKRGLRYSVDEVWLAEEDLLFGVKGSAERVSVNTSAL